MTQKSFVWEELIKNQLWTAEYVVPGFKARTTVLRLDVKNLLIFSPGGPLVESFAKTFFDKGQPTFLLLPNSFHHMGAQAWRQRFPQAKLICADGAAKRIAAKGHADVKPLSDLESYLPAHMTLLEPHGTRVGETWVRMGHGGKIIWIVCDAFFNMPRFSRRFMARLIQKITKAAPGLQVSTIAKYGLVKNRKAYKNWILEKIKIDNPTILIPAHGDVLNTEDLPEKLQEVMWRRF